MKLNNLFSLFRNIKIGSDYQLDVINKLLFELQGEVQISCLGIFLFDDNNQIISANIPVKDQETISKVLISHLNDGQSKIITLNTDSILLDNNNHYLYMNKKEYEHIGVDIIEFISFELSNLVETIALNKKVVELKKEINIRQRILDHMPEMIAIKDTKHKFLFINKAADDAFKGDFDTIAGKFVEQIYPQSEVEKIYKLDQDVYDADEPIKTNIEMLISKGFIHAESDRRIFKDDDQKTIGILTVNRDITQKKIIEDQLKSSLKFQDKLLAIAQQFINIPEDNVDEAIDIALGVSGSFISADRAYVFNYDLDKRIMINTYEWCSAETEPSIHLLQEVPIDEFIEDWYNPHLEGKEIYVPYVDQLDHNSNLYAILNMQEIKSVLTIPLSYDNKLIGFIGFDATKANKEWSTYERRLLKILAELIVNLKRNQSKNIELMQAKLIAEQASKSKAMFLANMSHEIKTPLSGVYSAISLLQETKADLEQLEYIDIAKASIESLSCIINDILDLTKFEYGNIKLEETFFNLENELYQIFKMQESEISQKGLDFDLDFDYRINHLVFFDRLRLRQILLNLISNAIKFTPEGMVQLSVRVIDENSSSYHLKFSVLDTGIGIDKDILSHITEQFVQGDIAATKNFSGTGLGLSIIKALLENYNSEIKIDSALGFGSKFEFSLILDKGVTVIEKLEVLKDQKMLILTHPDSKLIKMKSFFNELGIRTHFNFFQNALFSDDLKYDYIMLHVSNIKSDKRIIRDVVEKYGKKDTKFILCLTSNEVISNDQLIDMKIDYLCTFPTTREKFVQSLFSNQTLRRSRKYCSVDLNAINDSYENLKILVVDDNKINSQAIGAILGKRKIHTVLACSGYEAIEYIQKETFDIILMDIQMPNMDGFTTAKMIRDLDFSMDDLPIIAMSATILNNSIDSPLNLVFNDSIPKPFKVDELMKKIAKYTKSPTQKNTSIKQIPTELKPFNEISFINIYDQKPELGNKIINGFKEDYVTDITKIELSFSQNNLNKLMSEAHYFKGSASYVSAERVAWICGTIIDLCKENITLGLKELVFSLSNEIELWESSIDLWTLREDQCQKF